MTPYAYTRGVFMNFLSKYYRRKSIAEVVKMAEKSNKLVRSLGPMQLILMGIGAIVGAGIFVLTGEAASQHAGPAITLSFALSGLACICAALCYAELSSMIPVSGSAYTYIYVTLGEFAACVMVGFMTMATALSIASVASGWSGYVLHFLADFGIYLPPQFTAVTGHIISLADGTQVAAFFDLPAFFIVMLVTVVLYFGIETSAAVNSVIVFIKMSVLLLFVILGALYIDPQNWIPFIPENEGTFGKFGLSGILAGASMVFLAYNGFDAVASAAQETKNPQRDIPIGIIGSCIICIITYIAVSGVLTGLVPYTELAGAKPIAIAVDRMQMPWFAVIVKIGAAAGLTSVVLVMLYSLIRILFAVASDGLLPKIFAKVHKKSHVPHVLTVICGLVIAVTSATIPLGKLVQLANFGILGTFTIVCFAALLLRYTQPALKRVFSCPFMPFTPLLGMALLIQIIAGLSAETYMQAAVWIVIVIVIYLSYGQFHSKLATSKRSK